MENMGNVGQWEKACPTIPKKNGVVTRFISSVGNVGNDFHGREIGESKKKKRAENVLYTYNENVYMLKWYGFITHFRAFF